MYSIAKFQILSQILYFSNVVLKCHNLFSQTLQFVVPLSVLVYLGHLAFLCFFQTHFLIFLQQKALLLHLLGQADLPSAGSFSSAKTNEQKLQQFSITLVETFLIAFTIIKKDDDVTYSGLPSRSLLLQKDLILLCFLPWEKSYKKKPQF